MAFFFQKLKKSIRLQYPPKHPFDAGPGVGSRLYEALPNSFPVVSYSLILISGVIFFLTDFQNVGEAASGFDLMERRQELGYRDHLNTIVRSPWGVISSAVFHGGPIHVLFNCMLMFSFGTLLERGLGSAKTLLFYLLLALVTSSSQILVTVYPLLKYNSAGYEGSLENLRLYFGGSLGLSGILYGILGFMWGAWKRWTGFLAYFNQRTLTFFLFWLLLCYVISYSGAQPIANTAHVTGLVFGFLVGMWSCYGIKNAKLWFGLSVMMLAGVIGGMVYYHFHFTKVLAPHMETLESNGNILPW